MSNNLQLFIFLALGLLVSVLAAREVRRVFRSREPKGHAELAAEQLAYAQRQYLLHQALTEEHRALAEMFQGQAMRLTDYVAVNPAPMVMTWKRGDLKSMITPEGPKVVRVDTRFQQTSGDMQELPHEALRKTWRPDKYWECRCYGQDWVSIPIGEQPSWNRNYQYREVVGVRT